MVGVVGSSPIVPTNSSVVAVELDSEVKLKWKRIRGFHFCFPPPVFLLFIFPAFRSADVCPLANLCGIDRA
jgi:hypothetical protein